MQRATAIIVAARTSRLRHVGGRCHINSKRRSYYKYSPPSSSLLSAYQQQQSMTPPCASSSLSNRYFATTDTNIDNNYQEELPTIPPQSQTTNTTPQQSNLLQFTLSILPPLSDCPPGTLSYTQLITISNCIDQWISRANRAHKSVGDSSSFFGEQDVAVDSILKLVKRLIIERGGGQSLISNTDDNNQDDDDDKIVVTTNILSKSRRNEEVTYEMFKLHSIIQYLNVIYANNVKEFARVILDIVTLFEKEEYTNDNNDDGGEYYFVVPYKSIISSLCAQHTTHAAVTAQLVLRRFETRQLQQQQQHEQPQIEVPTTESYNNIMSCWRKSSAVVTPRHIDNNITNIPPTNPQQQNHHQHQDGIAKLISLLPYQHHTNPVSNILYQMIELYNSNPESMRRMKPNYISFNTAITSTSRDEFNNNSYDNGNDHNNEQRRRRSMSTTCFEHLQNMLQYYNHGSDEKCAPDLLTFSTVLFTLGRSSRGGGGNNQSRQTSNNKVNNRSREDGDTAEMDDADKACWILDKMLELSNVLDHSAEEYNNEGNVDKTARSYDYEFDIIPRNRHFNVVLTLLGNKYNISDETLQRAQRYVNIMEELEMQEDGNGYPFDNPPPTYDDVALLEGGDGRGYAHEQGFHGNDERTQFSMTRSAPDTLTYNTLINIAARCGKPEVAEKILNNMIQKSSSNEGGGGKMHVKPDNISFNTVLSAWAKMKNKKGMDRAEEILHRMQEMANDDDSSIRPDRVSFFIYTLSGLKLV